MAIYITDQEGNRKLVAGGGNTTDLPYVKKSGDTMSGSLVVKSDGSKGAKDIAIILSNLIVFENADEETGLGFEYGRIAGEDGKLVIESGSEKIDFRENELANIATGTTDTSAATVGQLNNAISGGKPVLRLITLKNNGMDGWLTGTDGTATQMAAVPGVLADEGAQLILTIPAAASRAAWETAGVRCTAQGAGTLTFEADDAPGTDLQVYIVIQEVTAG